MSWTSYRGPVIKCYGLVKFGQPSTLHAPNNNPTPFQNEVKTKNVQDEHFRPKTTIHPLEYLLPYIQ